jgi:hypothetical protein
MELGLFLEVGIALTGRATATKHANSIAYAQVTLDYQLKLKKAIS